MGQNDTMHAPTPEALREVFVGPATFTGDHQPDDLHDESLHGRAVVPFAVTRPQTVEEVQALVRFAHQYSLPITARGSGTGLSGGATPLANGLVICFDRMNQVLRVDRENHVAVVQPGVTLRDLNLALEGSGLQYPVYPGELSGSLGGNVNTNAGGMRAVRHGVTRNHVLGLELVLMNGEVLRTGGPVVKSSSGYNLTQLVIGSEGTLALTTEVTLRLSPVMPHSATLLVPFSDLRAVTSVVPTLIAAGLQPGLLEYIDVLTMAGITQRANLELGVPTDVAAQTMAYLVVVLETRTPAQLEMDIAAAAELVTAAGALDVYVLEGALATRLIEAREQAFWVSKAAGAHEIIDIVVPRSTVPDFMASVQRLATTHESFVAGCGHVGDGNIHLSVFQPDEDKRRALILALFELGLADGGQISGEHGIGLDKQEPYLALTGPNLIALQRAIKHVFDPSGLLNPDKLFGA
jgi:glycolate oxidase